jgi:hypothetical protein
LPTTGGGGREGGRGARTGQPDQWAGQGETASRQIRVQEAQGRGCRAGQEGGAPSKTLTVMYSNAQSLVGKVNELSCVASDINPDIILVTESWCNESISDAYLSIQGYELKSEQRLDRSDTGAGRGGGLIVYAKKELSVLKLDQDARHSQICKFSVSDVAFYLVYRPPSAPADSITELANIVRSAEKSCVFIGDFNLPLIDWEAGTARGRLEELLEAVQDRMMEQLVEFPNQVKGNTLDLVITSIPERIEEVCEAGRLGKSDHTVIITKVSIGVSMEEEKSQPD